MNVQNLIGQLNGEFQTLSMLLAGMKYTEGSSNDDKRNKLSSTLTVLYSDLVKFSHSKNSIKTAYDRIPILVQLLNSLTETSIFSEKNKTLENIRQARDLLRSVSNNLYLLLQTYEKIEPQTQSPRQFCTIAEFNALKQLLIEHRKEYKNELAMLRNDVNRLIVAVNELNRVPPSAPSAKILEQHSSETRSSETRSSETHSLKDYLEPPQ
jgi:hypothetical protein